MFGVCLAVAVAAVSWMSVRALEADDAQAAARRQAALEENAQLALWRMDSAMAPLVAQESARPYFTYESFYTLGRPAPAGKGKSLADSRIPSPLLIECPPEVLLHFQIGPNDRFSSPRVPDAAMRSRAIPRYLSEADAARAAQWLDRVRSLFRPAELWSALPSLDASATGLNVAVSNNSNGGPPAPNGPSRSVVAMNNSLANGPGLQQVIPQQPAQQQQPAGHPAPQQSQEAAPQQLIAQQDTSVNDPFGGANGPGIAPNAPPQALNQPDSRAANEFNARSQYLSQNFQTFANSVNGTTTANGGALETSPGVEPPRASSAGSASPADARASVMKPLWVRDQLILARRVRINDRDYIQGCLLDWSTIERQLLASVHDLLPDARLSPVAVATADEPAHMLASLPIRLELGSLAETVRQAISPVRLSLMGAWAALLLAALAVAALLQGVMSLSERRGAFVSAVTHELRTPLTTFRMYAEMLADNMLPDESSRRHYLETLRVEADRLTHLVENVLLYARLERGRAGGRIAPVAVSQILAQSLARLTDRARQANLELVVEFGPALRETRMLADPAAVEQILFNLVDNACKYAMGADNRTLHLVATRSGSHVQLQVRDHGPGIAGAERRLLFQPFRKSASDAARTAPGVGLGLALCRRLARDMGGDLAYAPDPAGGACFTLRLRAC